MRLLVLDGSRVLPSLVHRLAPAGVDVETSRAFGEALETLQSDPPEAVIVNLTPADLPWHELIDRCRQHSPAIPVLLESCVFASPAEAGLEALGRSEAFLAKPYTLGELRDGIDWLVRIGRAQRRPAAGEPAGRTARVAR